MGLDDGRLLRIDPATGSVRAAVNLGGPVTAVTAAGDDLWAARPGQLSRLRIPYGAVQDRGVQRRAPLDTGPIHGELFRLSATDEVGFDRLAFQVVGQEAPGVSVDHAGWDVRPTRNANGVRAASFLAVRIDLHAIGEATTGQGPSRLEVDGANVVEVVRAGHTADSITWTVGLRRRPAVRVWTDNTAPSYCNCVVLDVA